tara:strand:+ start:19 stop:444 length:426 start_codon:yes stop_codon:yes gene_type:complete
MRLDNLVTPTQKQTSKIDEGLRPGDLEHLILPNVSVDEFEPKSGQPDNVVVVGFFAEDQEPANDLASFIERGSHDILDTEVSPAPDEEGRYLIFVEMNRDESMFDNTTKILKDIGKLTKVDEWEIKFHGSDNTIRIKKESM